MKFADLIDNKLTRSNLDKLHKEIFDFDYPFYDMFRKTELERKLLRHYMFFPIGFDDLDTFKFYLENYFQTQVATYYNSLYRAQDGLRPYEAVGLRTSTTINGNTSTNDNTTNNVNVTGKDTNTSNTTSNNTSNNSSETTTNTTSTNETNTTSNSTQATKNTQKGGTNSTVTDNTQTQTTNNVTESDLINTTSRVTGGDTTVYGKKINVNYDYPVNVESMSELAGTTASVENDHTDRVNKDTTTTDTGTNTKTNDTTTNTRNTGTVTTTNGVTDDYETSSNVTGNVTDNVTGNATDKVTGSVKGNATDKLTSDTTGSSTSTSDTRGTTEHTGEIRNNQSISVNTTGLANSLSEEYLKYKTAIDNIDLMVINGCRDLFMIVWD